ncbi:predicted protein [Botrytis cinerea T4]|uniref:Uncharacterized protein n=1 Tax=Botryotinia fuckeliana (strain T4) TaxID=999810 RepID=G2YJF8_BOTF4|nr:predicted protein [Botrytis cinerea T4]
MGGSVANQVDSVATTVDVLVTYMEGTVHGMFILSNRSKVAHPSILVAGAGQPMRFGSREKAETEGWRIRYQWRGEMDM